MSLGAVALRWIISAGVTMAAVGLVSPGNSGNTFMRALGVTAIVALLVTPVMYFWFLFIPGIVALIAWFLIYRFAYNLGFLHAFVVGIVQAALAWGIDVFLVRGRLH